MLYDLFKEWLVDGGIQTRTSQKDEKYSVETERDSATAKARDGKGDSGRDVYTKKWARERPHKWDSLSLSFSLSLFLIPNSVSFFGRS